MTTDSRADAISILIRSFNSAKTIGRLLSSLPLKPGDEVLVVDSGSTDKTLAIAASHSAQILHAPPPFNYSKSLNIGFQAARNPWVLVISSHALPLVPDLLDTFRRAGREFPERTVVGYGSNVFDRRKPTGSLEVAYFPEEMTPRAYAACMNSNTLYRRSAWETVPFNEGIRTGEDKAWLTDIMRLGYTAALVPAARAINLNQYSLRYMFMKGYSDACADPGRPLTGWNLFLGVASMGKHFAVHGMPLGNSIRGMALTLGHFFGSHQKQDNRPWSKP
jgi:rhamnosyltransferase